MSQFAERIAALGHFIRIYAVSGKNHCTDKLVVLCVVKKSNTSTFDEEVNERDMFEETLKLFSSTKFHW